MVARVQIYMQIYANLYVQNRILGMELPREIYPVAY